MKGKRGSIDMLRLTVVAPTELFLKDYPVIYPVRTIIILKGILKNTESAN
jgi:hypothetical protein